MEPPLQSSAQHPRPGGSETPLWPHEGVSAWGSDTHHKPHANIFQANLVLAMTDGNGWTGANVEVLMFPTDQR